MSANRASYIQYGYRISGTHARVFFQTLANWNSTNEITKRKIRKIFYCQEPQSGESTTTECGVNYQLLVVTTEAAQ